MPFQTLFPEEGPRLSWIVDTLPPLSNTISSNTTTANEDGNTGLDKKRWKRRCHNDQLLVWWKDPYQGVMKPLKGSGRAGIAANRRGLSSLVYNVYKVYNDRW